MNIDPNAYMRTPPAIIQAAKGIHYYEEQWERLNQKHTSERRQFLSEFKESGTWRGKWTSWNECCEKYLELSRRRVDQLISEFNVKQTPEGGHPDSDKAAVLATVNDLPDPMADLEAQIAKAVVVAGAATELEPTAPEPTSKPNVSRDLIGFPIPAFLSERWNQRQEVQDRITAASKLRCALEEIANKGHQNPLYGAFDWQGMIRTIGQLQFHLGQCKPEVVCYECDGDYLKLKASKGGDGITRHCHACNDRGFITQSAWDKYSDSKLEIIQKRVNARLAKCGPVEENL